MALNSQLYLQHLNGDESRKDNTRYLIIEDGTARYMKNMQEKTIPVFSHGRLYAIAQGIVSLPNPELSADIAVRTLLGFYEQSLEEEISIMHFVLESHKKLIQKRKDVQGPPIGVSISFLWFPSRIENTVFYGNIGCTRIHRKNSMGMQSLTTLQTRTEFAKRQDLPPPENGDRLAQGLFFGRVYPHRTSKLHLIEGLDYGSENIRSETQYILSTSPRNIPNQERYSTQRDAQYSEMDTMDIPEPIEEGFEDLPTGEGIRGGSIIISS